METYFFETLNVTLLGALYEVKKHLMWRQRLSVHDILARSKFFSDFNEIPHKIPLRIAAAHL
jgi:hypothetical protein